MVDGHEGVRTEDDIKIMMQTATHSPHVLKIVETDGQLHFYDPQSGNELFKKSLVVADAEQHRNNYYHRSS